MMIKIMMIILLLLNPIAVGAAGLNPSGHIDVRRPIDERAEIDERKPIDIRYGIDVDQYERGIYSRFGEFVDDVYTISIKSESEINANITVDGVIYDLSPILRDVAIGSAVIITTAAIPVLAIAPTGLTTSLLAVFVTKLAAGSHLIAKSALVSAAINEGITAVKAHIETDGNFHRTLYAALEGAGNGYKWGAIVAGVANVANSAIFVAQHGKEYVVYGRELIHKQDIPWLDSNLNRGLASSRHQVSNVQFNEKIVLTNDGLARGVFPEFPSEFNYRLPKTDWLASDRVHFTQATEALAKEINTNAALAKQFSPIQVQQILDGLTPDGFTWHHSEEAGLLQLVESVTHSTTGHTGGRYIWGGGRLSR